MWSNIAIGSVMLVITTTIHAAFMMLAIRAVIGRVRHERRARGVSRLVPVAGTVLLMFGASLIEVAAWAGAYTMFGAISGAEPALYFSTVTYTTLGYGDMVLEPGWRLLAGFEAANGIIMFGWTTALVVAAVQQIYSRAHR